MIQYQMQKVVHVTYKSIAACILIEFVTRIEEIVVALSIRKTFVVSAHD